MTRKRAFRIGRSRTGLGLFATAAIKKGAFIVEYKGRKLTTEQADKLEARCNRYLYEINSRWTIDGTSRKNLGRYANHSCQPNAEAHTIGHKVMIRAIKNIRTGAEITYNYGRDYLTNVITRRGCKCDRCRKKRAGSKNISVAFANRKTYPWQYPRGEKKEGNHRVALPWTRVVAGALGSRGVVRMAALPAAKPSECHLCNTFRETAPAAMSSGTSSLRDF